MAMIRFECDYQEGCHPRILERLAATNMEQTSGYGVDQHCDRAKALIRDAIEMPDADVHFLVGGTQANTVVIKSLLASYEGVVCADSGHINVHESGAIESTGHKVIALPGHNGLLDADDLKKYLTAFYRDETHEHMVQPGMVYISYSSECGTLYTRSNLEALHAVCGEYKIPLFIDGARLGYALMAQNDLTIKDIARLCDVFYIGGTKVGALFGEAVVFTGQYRPKNFRTTIKQQGGMLAKGRMLGIQFETLFEDGLYFNIARHADEQALRIKNAFEAKGIEMLYGSTTNQQFPILTEEQIAYFAKNFSFERWQPMPDGKYSVRFCTSWTTPPENVDALLEAIHAL